MYMTRENATFDTEMRRLYAVVAADYFAADGSKQPIRIVEQLIVVLDYIGLFFGNIVALGNHFAESDESVESRKVAVTAAGIVSAVGKTGFAAL